MIAFVLGYFNDDISVLQWILVSLWEFFVELMIWTLWCALPIAVR